MKWESGCLLALAVLLIGSGAQSASREQPKRATLALDKLELRNVKAEPVTYLGRRAMRLSRTFAVADIFRFFCRYFYC
jgi:hypothetical protein